MSHQNSGHTLQATGLIDEAYLRLAAGSDKDWNNQAHFFSVAAKAEWTHGNSLFELPDGNLLLSYRNISTVVKIDRRSGRVVWKLGIPPLSGQHALVALANGNILLFDNGPTRLDETFPYSRVLEINPATNEIVWKYQDPNPTSFYSDRVSNAQRLPNGNTLINEGMFGRFFEVTSDGEVVWEYVSPYFGPPGTPPRTQTNGVFRAYRYTEEEVARARNAQVNLKLENKKG